MYTGTSKYVLAMPEFSCGSVSRMQNTVACFIGILGLLVLWGARMPHTIKMCRLIGVLKASPCLYVQNLLFAYANS